jgi:hypothetical protein
LSTEGLIIFPFYTFERVNDTFRTESDQRMTIKFFLNKGANAGDIADRLQAQFREHADELRTVSFWIIKVQLDRQDIHEDIPTLRPPVDDLDFKILAILDTYPFKSTCSIAEILAILY